jgi:hypothetical protein
MAIKFPDAKSVLFDIEEALLEIAKQNAELNNIKNCEFTSRCNDLEFFENLLRQAKSPLIIMDCEGHEAYILEPDRVPSLKKSTLLVEIHEFLKVGLTDLIAKKFHKSHDVKVLLQGAKNYHIEPILAFSDVDKFIINNENRPCTMHWMYMTPKG